MIVHNDLEALCSRYDGFLLDLWGVVMDGVRAFPGALAWLARRRAGETGVVPQQRLPHDGGHDHPTRQSGHIPRASRGATTSGQLAMDALTDPRGPFARGAIHIAGEIPDLNGWPAMVTARFTAHIEHAALLVATGSFPPAELTGRLTPLLDALDKPMICANPDRG